MISSLIEIVTHFQGIVEDLRQHHARYQEEGVHIEHFESVHLRDDPDELMMLYTNSSTLHFGHSQQLQRLPIMLYRFRKVESSLSILHCLLVPFFLSPGCDDLAFNRKI